MQKLIARLWITFAILAVGLAPTATGGELADVMEAARAANHIDSWQTKGSTLVLSGDTKFRGVETGMQVSYAPNGSYRYDFQGPFDVSTAWNSKTAWTQEAGGPCRLVNKGELDEEHLPQWIHSGFWSTKDVPIQITLVEETQESITLELNFVDSTLQCTLILDAQSMLPLRTISKKASGDFITEYSDYRIVAGVPIAHNISTSGGGVDGYVRVKESAASTPHAPFTMKPAVATDTSFLADVPASIEVKRTNTGHILVHPIIDGKDTGWFIFDSGAGMTCIDPAVAEKLNLPKFGAVPVVGVGGSMKSGFRQGSVFELGPMRVDKPIYLELDLSFLEPVFGVRVAGICGYDMFARATIELNLAESTIAIHDPNKYALTGGKWMDLHLDGRLPCIEASFEGDRSGLFKIDTGDAGTVNFYTHAVAELSLLKGRKTTTTMTGGVGGMFPTQRGDLEWFEIGGHRFTPLPATFVTSDKGAFSGSSVLGSIGGTVLKPFTLVFNYPHSKLALIKNKE